VQLRIYIFYSNTIYINSEFFENLATNTNSFILTPIIGVKANSVVIKQLDKAVKNLFSKAVYTAGQPIKSLFKWLVVKTDLQGASNVHFIKGLLVHIFCKIAAALIYLIF